MAVKRDKIIANAEKLVAKGKIEHAIKEYERLLDDNPGDVNTLNRVGDLWVRINRTNEAVGVFREIADRYSKDGFFLKAIAIYKKINKLDPSRLEVYGELAELYAKQGLAMEAKSQYQVLADYHLKQGDPGNALGVYRKIAELDPNSINVHVRLADLYSQNSQVKEALAEYDRVGKMLLKRGMLDEALQVFRKALKIDPKNVDLAASLVDTLLEAKDFDNAVNLLDNTLESNPGNPKLVSLLGRTHLSRGDVRAAREALLTGLDSNPADVSLRTILSEVHLKEGAPDDALNVLGPVADSLAAEGDGSAIELLNKIIAIEPLHTPTLAKIVDVYRALKRETNILAALNSLAEAYIAIQDFEHASSTLEDLIDREPQNAQHKDKLAFVRKSLGLDVAEPAEVAEAPEPEEVEEAMELPEVDDVAPPDIEIDLDAAEPPDLDFGELPDESEVMEVAEEPSVDFSEPEESTTAPQLDEDVDFITEHLTEAEVFAKYGLAEKAIEHLETILERAPDHLEVNERLLRLLLDEGLRDKAADRAAELLGIFQSSGDDESFDRWFNDLIGKGFAVSPGPPVEVSSAEEDVSATPRQEVTKPVPAITEPEEIEDEAEVSLDFDDMPSVEVEEPVEEEVSLEFDEPEVVTEEPEVEETVAELDFGEEAAEEPAAELDFEEEEAEEEQAEESAAALDFGEKEAEEPAAELDFGEESVALDFGDEEPQEEVAELDFGDEASKTPASEEVAELDFGEEPAPEPPIEAPAPADELSFDMGASTALGGPPVEEIGELDFYVEQELFDEARIKLEALLAQFPDSEELLERKTRIEVATAPPPPEEIPSPKFSAEDIESELLAAIPEDDEDVALLSTPPAPAESEPLIDESDLFDGEDDFFDLASELEDDLLDDEEPISLAEEEQSLEDIFREFKKGVEQQLDSEDYETHYNLGIAYKEMGLIDEAIGEFQVASKDPARMIECCSMLGLCFLEKGMPQLAVKWYKKGLESAEISEEENLGLLYDLGSAYLESGDTAGAQKAFMEVYGSNSNYRDIVSKMKQIEEAKK